MSKQFGNMFKQAQQMQQRMTKMQEELGQKSFEASSGGGMVKCVVNGRQEIISLTIDKEVVNPDDVEMLQDLILVALNDAVKKSQVEIAAEMQKITGGMGLNLPKFF